MCDRACVNVQQPQAQTANEAAHLRAFALNALRSMKPAFPAHTQFCERVLQLHDALRDDRDLLDALCATLKEHGIPLPAAAAALAPADAAAKALPAASALPGAAPDKPPGLAQRRRTEATPRAGDAAAAVDAAADANASPPELFRIAKERKAAARALWQNVRPGLLPACLRCWCAVKLSALHALLRLEARCREDRAQKCPTRRFRTAFSSW